MRDLTKKRLLVDAILILSILLVALIIWLVGTAGRRDGAYVLVTVEGVEVARYRLDVDGEYDLNSGTNHLVISSGTAYLDYADCPDHLCVKQGKIRYGGQSIVCLPNRLVVRVVAEDDVELIS